MDGWKMAGSYATRMEAEMFQSILEANGVQSVIMPSGSTAKGLAVGGNIFVAPDLWDIAREILGRASVENTARNGGSDND